MVHGKMSQFDFWDLDVKLGALLTACRSTFIFSHPQPSSDSSPFGGTNLPMSK